MTVRWVLPVVACSPAAFLASASPVVHVDALGSVQGAFQEGLNATANPTNISAFWGIPYALPPLRGLRWRAPVPRGPWAPRTLDARQPGHCCMQDPSQIAWPVSEDCLTLNVFAPTSALNGKRQLPVMLWIHGGSYVSGCANEYIATSLVDHSDLEVVAVTINYRLNVFGFLGSEDLKSRSSEGSFGNYGIQDQRQAMQWTSSHVGAFGGAPRRITVFGESAGAGSIWSHLVQPGAFSLYAGVIAESSFDDGAVSSGLAETAYATIKNVTTCGDLTCLLSRSSLELYNASSKVFRFGPVVDGVALPDTPKNLILRGEYNKNVPVLLGSNRDEVAFFFTTIPGMDVLVPHNLTEAQLDGGLADFLSSKNVEEVKKLYDPSNYAYPSNLGNYSQPWWTWIRAGTDRVTGEITLPGGAFLGVPGIGACGARNFSQAFYAGGSPAVFTYLFAHPPQSKHQPFVGHGDEIAFVFGQRLDMGINLSMPAGDEEYDLSKKMSRYWTNFARSGDPNGASLPTWPKYGEEGDVVLRLQTPTDGGIHAQHRLRKDACDFWITNPVASDKANKFVSTESVIV